MALGIFLGTGALAPTIGVRVCLVAPKDFSSRKCFFPTPPIAPAGVIEDTNEEPQIGHYNERTILSRVLSSARNQTPRLKYVIKPYEGPRRLGLRDCFLTCVCGPAAETG